MASILRLCVVALLSLAIFGSPQEADAGNIEAKLPTADGTDAFQVKDTNDTVLLSVPSSGNVGIGTTSPGEILQLERGPGSGISSMLIRSYLAGTGSFGKLQFQNVLVTDQGIAAEIEAIRPAATWGQESELLFKTNPGNSLPALAERMRITKDGNVGIGTSTPAARLDVAGGVLADYQQGFSSRFSTGGVSILSKVDTGSLGITSGIPNINLFGLSLNGFELGNTASGISGRTDTSQGISIFTAGSERLRVDSSGRVGIGTQAPADTLHVNGSLRLQGASHTAVRLITPGGDYRWEAAPDGSFYLYDQLNLAYRIGVTLGGNVGIGTEAPTQKLDVRGNRILLRNDSNGKEITLRTDGTAVDLGWSGAPLHIAPSSGASQNIYLLPQGGNVGIDTAAPTQKLDVNGSAIVRSNLSAGTPSLRTDATLYGETQGVGSAVGSSMGVFGWAASPNVASGGMAYGVLGRVNSYRMPNSSDPGQVAPAGVYGWGDVSSGVVAHGVVGYTQSTSAQSAAIKGTAGGSAYAGYFIGKVGITGPLEKPAGSFKIDHPLDPQNKYLYHSFVESPDMKNIYDGVVSLDQNGEAWVEMPEWFEALNMDFRYQLTSIGKFVPVFIAKKVSGNRFKIAGGKAGVEVSWQVTGIRQDAYANAHRIQVEEDKPVEERGTYLHPDVYGQQQ